MKKSKAQKHTPRRTAVKKQPKKKAVKQVSKKKSKPAKKIGKPVNKKTRKAEQKFDRLLSRGKERGFVTYDEILKEFPTVEENILLLDDLYEKLHTAGVDVLEGGGLLEIPSADGKAYAKSDSAYDSIQMYLKEIGQNPLISANMEKELARRIE